jgi:uncharacterized membrane protein
MNAADRVDKVPASAGAQWLLDGLANLRRAPLAFGLLGVIYGAIALLVGLAAPVNPGLFMALEVLLVLLGPLLMGGFVWAARSVASGGPALPSHLLEGMHRGRTGRLLATLLPNIAALVLCVVLLFAMVGRGPLMEIAQAVERAGAQATPDPALFADLPVGRLLLWFLLVIVIGVVASFFTFVAIPEIMFRDTSASAAMRRSFRACVRNLPALLVFLVLTFIAIVATYIGLSIVGLLVAAVLGEAAMQVVLQLLGSAVIMPPLLSAIYFAWRQMLDGEGAPAAAAPVTGIEA